MLKTCFGLMKTSLKVCFGAKNNTKHHQKISLPTVKNGGSIKLWSLFSSAGTGTSVKVAGIMNSSKDRSILAKPLQAWGPQGVNPNQQKNGFTRIILNLEWVSQSPGLNPSESLAHWFRPPLQRRVGKYFPGKMHHAYRLLHKKSVKKI